MQYADRSFGLDTVQEPGEANPLKGLRLVGEETQASRKQRLPRCCTGGCVREAGIYVFYPSLWKGRSLNLSAFAFPLLCTLTWESVMAPSCPTWTHERTSCSQLCNDELPEDSQEICLVWVRLSASWNHLYLLGSSFLSEVCRALISWEIRKMQMMLLLLKMMMITIIIAEI